MFTPEQYRAKAAEYAKFAKTSNRPSEVREFNKLEQSFTELAENEQWVADHHDQTLHAKQNDKSDEIILALKEQAYPYPVTER